MPCVYVLSFCDCVCMGVCICAHLCVILRTSFSVVHADCASYCARVQPIKVHIGTLALCLCLYLSHSLLCAHLSLFPSIFPFPYFSSPYDISAVLRQLLCTSPLCVSAIGFYQGSLSFLLLQIEAAALQKITVPLGENFGFRTTCLHIMNKNKLRTSASVLAEEHPV